MFALFRCSSFKCPQCSKVPIWALKGGPDKPVGNRVVQLALAIVTLCNSNNASLRIVQLLLLNVHLQPVRRLAMSPLEAHKQTSECSDNNPLSVGFTVVVVVVGDKQASLQRGSWIALSSRAEESPLLIQVANFRAKIGSPEKFKI